MKKFLFAVQVFGIMMMFPLYVILEMNHGSASLDENKNHPIINAGKDKKLEKASVHCEAAGEKYMRVKYVWDHEFRLGRMK